jgi:hypothetical protein
MFLDDKEAIKKLRGIGLTDGVNYKRRRVVAPREK